MSLSFVSFLCVLCASSYPVKHDGTTQRFYRNVDIIPYLPTSIDAPSDSSSWALTLNNRPVLSAADQLVCMPTLSLARAIALEWEAQINRIVLSSMPLTHILVNAIDLVKPNPSHYIKHCFGSVISVDNICIRAPSPNALVKLQNKHWNPLLQWMDESFNIKLNISETFNSPQQSEEAQSKLNSLLHQLDPYTLSALDHLAIVSKSLIFGLAIVSGRYSLEDAYEVCRVEEEYQIRKYGRVEGIYGHGVDTEYVKLQIAAARTFLNLLQKI